MTTACLVVGPKLSHPTLVGDLPGHVLVRDISSVSIPPAQSVDQGHGPEVIFRASVHKRKIFRQDGHLRN